MPLREDIPARIAPPFGLRFCRKYRCTERGYQRRLFWRCLNRPAVPVALVVVLFAPGAFHSERVLIKDLWRVRNLDEVREAIRYYQGLQRSGSGLWRLRISSKRVIRMAEKVFKD